MKNITVYLKTTETCQLNCKHCFTNGMNGKKIFFNSEKTLSWMKKLREFYKDSHIHFEFHGGEPFLAPLSDMKYIVNQTRDWDNISFGVTSNLTFKLTEDKINFIMEDLKGVIGTSWDMSIRFSNEKQKALWEENVLRLKNLGAYITLFVSVTKELCNTDTQEIIEYINTLNVDIVDFERLTGHGNAQLHPEIFPTNKEQSDWFLKLYKNTSKKNWEDSFIKSMVNTRVNGNQTATFCRDCEQKLFTINADGSISGCPNSAPEEVYGTIEEEIWELIVNPKRMKIIACEAARDPRCYECDVFDICGSGCHQLEWDETHCPSPKELFRLLKNTPIKELKKGEYYVSN